MRLSGKSLGALGIAHDDENRVVAAQCADHIHRAHRVDRHRRRLTQTGKRLDDDHVLRGVDIGHALTENIPQTSREAVRCTSRRSRIFILSGLSGKRFDEPQLLDVARDCRLRGAVADRTQMVGQLLLRLDLEAIDQLQDLRLSLKVPFPPPLFRNAFFFLITASAAVFGKSCCP